MSPQRIIIKETIDRGGRLRRSRYALRYLHRRRGYVDGYAMLMRAGSSTYYHVLMDWLPRLLVLWQPEFLRLDNIKLLTSDPPDELQRYLLDRIVPPNCEVVCLDETRLYDVEKLIFTPFKPCTAYLTDRYASMFRERLLPNRQPACNRRILISRRGANRRRIENFYELETALSPFGFETVQPETLSMLDEIELFYDAEIVVGAHGSGLTNILFSHQTAVVEIFATPEIIPHFYVMSQWLGHDYRYVLGTGDDIYPTEYPIDVESVVAEVDVALPALTSA